MRNYFTYGGESSADYGVYISGAGTYNAPVKVYDMVSVAGRNGDLALYGGRYENIELAYSAFLHGDSTSFADKMAELRAVLSAPTGYQRLEDTYNPDEYRLGIFRSGLNVDATADNKAGTFDITFDCKPQRFLKSGETAQTFPDGGESSPNLLPYPYYDKTKTVNGITYTDNGDGTVNIQGTATRTADFVLRAYRDNFYLPPGEYIFSQDTSKTVSLNVNWFDSSGTYISTIFSSENKSGKFTITQAGYDSGYKLRIYLRIGARMGAYSNVTCKPMIRLASDTDSKWYPYWDGTKAIYNPTRFEAKPLLKVTGYGTLGVGDRSVIITGTAGQEIYIDCEIMEAWQMSGTAIIPRNDYVQYVGNKFPVLASGVNGISMSGNITKVEVVPRWWRL